MNKRITIEKLFKTSNGRIFHGKNAELKAEYYQKYIDQNDFHFLWLKNFNRRIFATVSN